ncbi:MAG TPA: STAS domain-containing protein [Actinomycetota bacterium]|jgi:anti-anti-sigma factor|nr:STAS domain-containing protein [Actinomycetota bacterium]
MELLEIHRSEPATFALVGELDMSSAKVLLSHLNDAPGDGDLVLELSALTFMDSSGLRAIMEVAQRRNGHSSVILRNATQSVSRVLEIALPGETPGVVVSPRGNGA